MSIKFAPGRLLATPGAMALPPEDVQAALARHLQGDWGDVGQEDAQANEDALLSGERLLSVYHTRDRTKFYIITEWDRSVTTALLPDEY
jgi:hypothetical protein